MTEMSLSQLSDEMAKIDFAMLTTRTEGGSLASRPMSNNGEVAYEGTSWFFSDDTARTIADIERSPEVGLTFTGRAGLLGKPPLFIAVEGRAALVRERAEFARRWTKDLDRWFPEGVDTPGLVLIRVDAERIHYWDGTEEGEVRL